MKEFTDYKGRQANQQRLAIKCAVCYDGIEYMSPPGDAHMEGVLLEGTSCPPFLC